MVDSPDIAKATREVGNLGIAQALGIDHDSLAALRLGRSLGMPDAGALARVFPDANTGQMHATIVADGIEYDVPLSDAQAAALVGGATTPSR